MRHLGQPEVAAEFGEVGEDLGDAAVVGLEERLEGQDGEQLVGGEVLAAAGGGVRGQRVLGQAQGLSGHGPGRLGHRS